MGTIISISAPTEDSFTVTNAAYWAAKNDFAPLIDINYFNYFPFQLGYVFFTEIQIRLFGGASDTLIYLEILNVIHLAFAYVGLILILGKLFKSRRVQAIAAVLMVLAAQPILFSTFLYGIIPGITFAIYALLFEIMYFQSEKKYAPVWALLSAICIAIATMIKTNNYIVLVALIIIALVNFLKRLKVVDACYIIVSLVLALSVNSAVISMYEKRADVDIQDGIPFVSWLAMGINESSIAPGWYNFTYTMANYEANNFNTEAASESSIKAIKERIGHLSKNYVETNDFFYEKIVSQWNEPSYQSIWTNEVRGRYRDMGKFAKWICEDGEPYVKEYMNLYQEIIFLAVFAGVIFIYKKKDILTSMLVLVVLGGFLYHTLFEGKSQYIMPYFIIMIAFAAYGISCLYDKRQEFLTLRRTAKASANSVEISETGNSIAIENTESAVSKNETANESIVTKGKPASKKNKKR